MTRDALSTPPPAEGSGPTNTILARISVGRVPSRGVGLGSERTSRATRNLASPSRNVAALTCRLDALSGNASALSDDIEALTGDIDALKHNADTLTGNMGVLKSDADALSRDRDALKANPDALTDDVETLKANVFAKLESHSGLICSSLNLENAVQPRMDTDGHGYQAVARNRRLTQAMSEKRSPKSVFIRVHPWLMILSTDSNCGM